MLGAGCRAATVGLGLVLAVGYDVELCALGYLSSGVPDFW